MIFYHHKIFSLHCGFVRMPRQYQRRDFFLQLTTRSYGESHEHPADCGSFVEGSEGL